MNTTGIMQITDTLSSGGTERVAVNLANYLPRDRYRLHLCTTRQDGPLASLVAEDVGRLQLNRKRTLDMAAVRRLAAYIRENDISILHAHSTSLYTAAMASLFPPYPAVIWHDHFGRCSMEERPGWRFRVPAARVSGIISVNEILADWSARKLGVRKERIWYIPNFVVAPSETETENYQSVDLPGKAGSRVVCVANLRFQKDHLTLVRAMASVVSGVPHAHLLLAGGNSDKDYLAAVQSEIRQLSLEKNVTWLGQRPDVPAILRACDIGVLSSLSEAFPLSLIEYGLAGLASVSTNVGQCAEVLEDGRSGLLVPPASPTKLSDALLTLLRTPELRIQLGERFRSRVQALYTPEPVIEQVCKVYETVLMDGGRQTTDDRNHSSLVTRHVSSANEH